MDRTPRTLHSFIEAPERRNRLASSSCSYLIGPLRSPRGLRRLPAGPHPIECNASRPPAQRQERTDLTAEFLQSMRIELEGMQRRADALAKVLRSGKFTERTKHRQATIAAVDAGLLRRELFVAGAGQMTAHLRS